MCYPLRWVGFGEVVVRALGGGADVDDHWRSTTDDHQIYIFVMFIFVCFGLRADPTAERHGLREAKKAEQIQMKIINTLREHIAYGTSDTQRKSYYFSRLLAKLPELRSLSVQGLQRIFYLKLEDLVPAPPLIENMFIASLPF